MSASNAFEIVVSGSCHNTRAIAAVIIEQALQRSGFVSVETVEQRDTNTKTKNPSLLELLRAVEPCLFEPQVTIREVTVLPHRDNYIKHHAGPEVLLEESVSDDPELASLPQD